MIENSFFNSSFNRPFLYAQGCELQYVDGNSINVLPGRVRDHFNKYDIVLEEPLTLRFDDVLQGKPNGIDRALNGVSIPSGGWFAIFLVTNAQRTVPTAAVATPFFPPFFDYSNQVPFPNVVRFSDNRYYGTYRHIGWVNFRELNSIVQIFPFDFYANGINEREIFWRLSVSVGEPNSGEAGGVFTFDTFNGLLNQLIAPNATFAKLKLRLQSQDSGSVTLGLIASDVDPVVEFPAFSSVNSYPFNIAQGTANGAVYNNEELNTFFQESSGFYGFGSKKSSAIQGANPPSLFVYGSRFSI